MLRVPYDPINDRLLPIRTAVGILVADDYSGSPVLGFFSIRSGLVVWPYRSTSRGGEVHVDVLGYFPIGGGIEVPKDGPVMFHFETGAVFPEALWSPFGWLPIYFEIGVVFRPGEPEPAR